jgi:hypothetical protein
LELNIISKKSNNNLKITAMKKILLFNFLSLIILIGLCFKASAQREVVIEGYPMTGDITKYVDAITKALTADAPNRVTDPNVVYVLKRGQIYPNATTIKNTFKLRMKASSGTGALPAIRRENTPITSKRRPMFISRIFSLNRHRLMVQSGPDQSS